MQSAMDGVKEAIEAVKEEVQTEVKPCIKGDAADPPAGTAAATSPVSTAPAATAPVSTAPEKK